MRRDPPKFLNGGLCGKGLRIVIPDSGMMGPDWRHYRHGHHRPHKPLWAYCAPVHTRYPLMQKGKRKAYVMSQKKAQMLAKTYLWATSIFRFGREPRARDVVWAIDRIFAVKLVQRRLIRPPDIVARPRPWPLIVF